MKLFHNFHFILKLLSILFLFGLNIAQAANSAITQTKEASANPSNEWQFLIAPYGWLASLSANANVQGINDHIFIPFSELLSHIKFVGELHLEATRGPWTFMLDPTYIKLKDNITAGPIYVGSLKQLVIGPISLGVNSQTLLIDGGVFYKFFKQEDHPEQPFSLELLAGGRYLGLKNSLSLGLSQPDFFPGINVTNSAGVIAPIIGLRIKHTMNKGFLWSRTDVGGFGVDHVKSTWGSAIGLVYPVSTHASLALAYRIIRMNVQQSNSSSFSMMMYGPEAGFVFIF